VEEIRAEHETVSVSENEEYYYYDGNVDFASCGILNCKGYS
jgi:hypothetical protein